jgi:hypothetical protein
MVIEQTGSGRAVISMPQLDPPELFQPEAGIVDPGPFQILDQGTTIQSGLPGEMLIEGVFGDATFDALLMTGSSRISVTRSDGSSTSLDAFDAGEADTGTEDLALPTAAEVHVRKTSYLLRMPQTAPGDQIYVGERLLEVGDGSVAVALLGSVALTAGRAWLVMLGALVLIGVCLVVGSVILRLFGVDRAPPAVHVSFGFGLLAISANTLAYFVPVSVTTLILAVGLGLLAWVGHRRDALGPAITSWREGSKAFLVVIPLAVVAFFPVLGWGPWFAGSFKTDLFEYSTLSSLLQDHSLFEMRTLAEAQTSGVLTSGAGFVWRSIDSVVASLISGLGGLTTIAGFTVLGLALTMLFGIGVADLAGGAGRARYIVVALALLNPMFTSLYMENYYSQFFFVAMIPGLIVSLGFLVATEAGKARVGASIALSAQAAAMIAVYPYFFAVVGVAALVGVLSFREHRALIRNVFAQVLVFTVVMVNLAWMTVVRFGETIVYEELLDAITRNVLLAGFGRVDIAEFLLGFRSYQWRDAGLSLQGVGDLGLRAAEWARLAAEPAQWWLAIGVGALAALLFLIDFKRSLASVTGRVTLVVAVTWVLFSGAHLLLGRHYVSLKGIWTGAALAPLLLAGAVWRPRTQRIALGFVGVLAVLWATTAVADRVYWLLPNPGSEVRSSHVAAVPDLVLADQVLASADGPVSMVRGEQPLLGLDFDRVLATHSTILTRDHDLTCVNCVGFKPPDNVACSTAGQGMLIVVGRTGESSVCELPIEAEGPYMELHISNEGGDHGPG